MDELLRRVCERDAEAFGRLFELYGPRVKSYMMRQGADAQLAEDLAQETMLTVWRKATLFSGERGSVTTWIFTIARNLRIDRLRREIPFQELPDEHLNEATNDIPADEAVLARERQTRIKAVLSELPPDQCRIVTLAYIEGLSHSAIAARLELPMGTVKSRMRLAYQKLRAAVEDLK